MKEIGSTVFVATFTRVSSPRKTAEIPGTLSLGMKCSLAAYYGNLENPDDAKESNNTSQRTSYHSASKESRNRKPRKIKSKFPPSLLCEIRDRCTRFQNLNLDLGYGPVARLLEICTCACGL